MEPRAFIDGVPALAWSALPDGSPEFFNQRFLDYSGLSSDQVYAEWKSVLHQDDVEGFETWCGELQKSQNLGQTEVRFRRADGEYRWFEISAAPVHDEQGRLIRWYGINIDIDDRRRAEEKLRQERADLLTITDCIRQAIGVLSPDGTILYANRVALESTGLPSIDDKTYFTRVVHPDDADSFRAERQKGLLRGSPFELEVRLLMRNRQCRWYLMQYSPLKDEHGRVIRWYVTATDIDDLKRVEQKLRQSEEELRTITDSIRQPIVVLAPDGTTLYVNKVGLDFAGTTMGQLKEQGVYPQFAHPDYFNRIQAERRKGLLQEVPFEVEGCLLTKGVEYRWCVVQY